ncbi:MAG: hypothetical protein R3F15_08435 [Lysobacterales bacterium]
MSHPASVDIPENEASLLRQFGYTSQWLAHDFLTMADLRAQIEELERSGDTRGEHYRYGSFIRWLNGRGSASNEELNHFLDLALGDPDRHMGHSAAIELLRCCWLSDAQFGAVCERLQRTSSHFDTHIRRHSHLRALANDPGNAEIQQRSLDSGDGVVQEALADLDEVSPEILAALAEKGVVRRVRSIAKQRLGQRR